MTRFWPCAFRVGAHLGSASFAAEEDINSKRSAKAHLWGGFAHYPVACPTYARDPTIMKSRPFLSGFLSRYRLIPACSHLALFAIVWIAAAIDPRPVLDGMARWGIWLLTLADFPFSVVGFSLMWDQRRLLGGLIWGCGGTLLWYVLGGVFFRSKLNRPAP